MEWAVAILAGLLLAALSGWRVHVLLLKQDVDLHANDAQSRQLFLNRAHAEIDALKQNASDLSTQLQVAHAEIEKHKHCGAMLKIAQQEIAKLISDLEAPHVDTEKLRQLRDSLRTNLEAKRPRAWKAFIAEVLE